MRSARLRARFAAAALALTAVCGSLIAAQSATAATVPGCTGTVMASPQKAKLAIGAQFHGTWASMTDTDRTCILNAMADAGATWVRVDVGWTTIQPDGRGSYHMAWGVPFVDKVLNMAHARGLKVMATFWQTPQWASGSSNPHVLPKNPADYAAALKWAAARWKTQVQAWEIWNEPNTKDFLSPPDPAAYTRLLKAAYPAVKAGNPKAQVIFGGTMFVDTDWIGKAYAAGAKGSYDAMAVHPYMGNSGLGPEAADTGRERLSHTAALVKLMNSKGEGAKPIWFTEFGWSTHTNTSTTPVWFKGVTESVQATYLTRQFAFVEKNYPQVKNMFWYNSNDTSTGKLHPDNRGLLRRDYSRKPVFNAMKCYTRALAC